MDNQCMEVTHRLENLVLESLQCPSIIQNALRCIIDSHASPVSISYHKTLMYWLRESYMGGVSQTEASFLSNEFDGDTYERMTIWIQLLTGLTEDDSKQFLENELPKRETFELLVEIAETVRARIELQSSTQEWQQCRDFIHHIALERDEIFSADCALFPTEIQVLAQKQRSTDLMTTEDLSKEIQKLIAAVRSAEQQLDALNEDEEYRDLSVYETASESSRRDLVEVLGQFAIRLKKYVALIHDIAMACIAYCSLYRQLKDIYPSFEKIYGEELSSWQNQDPAKLIGIGPLSKTVLEQLQVVDELLKGSQEIRKLNQEESFETSGIACAKQKCQELSAEILPDVRRYIEILKDSVEICTQKYSEAAHKEEDRDHNNNKMNL